MGVNVKILKTDKRLVDEGYRYRIDGYLVSDGGLDLTDLDKPLYVNGSIKPWDMGDGEDDCECPDCEKVFSYERIVTIEYSTSKVED